MPACKLPAEPRRSGCRRLATTTVVLSAASASTAFAHPVEGGATPETIWRSWTLEPLVVMLLVATALIYTVGVVRLRRAPRGGRAVHRWHVVAFAAGWVTTAIALVSPLDAAAGALFSAHMVQHELLMIVAAPLLVAGMPAAAIVWAAPGALRRAGGITRAAAQLLAAASAPAAAWVLHAAAIVTWHVPVLFDAAVHNDVVHAVQHGSFFGTALLFWWGLLRARDRKTGYGVAVVSVFTTAVYTSVIGALLAVAPRAWYSAYASSPSTWGLTPLDDQQLGGLIMWVPGGIVYTAAGLWLFAAWLRESEHRAGRRPTTAPRRAVSLLSVALLLVVVAASACTDDVAKAAAAMTGGDPERGRD